MQTMTVEKKVAADPAKVWDLLADFGDVHWIPIAGDVRTEGAGPGMRRFISGGGDQPVIERLISVDDASRSLTYAIDQGMPLPVASYTATAVVGGDTEATVTWTVEYEPTGPDDGVRAGTEAIYGAMAQWLEDAARQ